MFTGTPINFQNAAAVCDLFDRAAEAHLQTPGRSGSVVDLPSLGRLLLTGDLHDHRENLMKVLKLAHLEDNPHHHLLMQEVIHGEPTLRGHDFSYRTLARIAQLKIERPGQVHQVLSNHELSQAMIEGILKDGRSVTDSFDEGLSYVFGQEWTKVSDAIGRYIRSMPLAVRCGNGVFASHSLPSPRQKEGFDPDILRRALVTQDLCGPRGGAHLMVWGRNLTQEWADELARHWNAAVFVLGHQPADMGWEAIGKSLLILNSDHAHGVALPVDLSRRYTRDELIEQIIPLNAVM